MNEMGLRAIEVVDFGPYDDDVYGATDILVFTDGKLVVPGIHYTFDGSKLEFKIKPRTDVIIYTFETKRNIVCGSFRIIRANAGVHTCKIPENIPQFTGKIVETSQEEEKVVVDKPKSWKSSPEDVKDMTVNFDTPSELSEEEINDITISQLGETTEPKEVE